MAARLYRNEKMPADSRPPFSVGEDMPQKKDTKHVTLAGDRVRLRPLQRDDLGHIMRWSEDEEIRKMTGEVNPMTRPEAEEFYEKVQTDSSRVWFAIVLRDGDRVIGETGLLRMFEPWRCTDMTVILGEKDVWGQGYGVEAGRLVLDYAFRELGFHRVAIGVVGFNERAIRFWKSLGFREEGVQRDGYYCDGRFSDFVMMSILESEHR